MRGLDRKVALVSGAARGMGAAIARRLVDEGATVILGDIRETEGKATADELGPAARFVRLDVTDEDSWQEAIAFAEREFERLDVLVNNAGILGFSPIADLDRADFERIIGVNQTGVFLGMKTAVPALKRAGGGAIVNLSSVEGIGGGQFLTAYTGSKFAVRGMTKAVALELGGDGIRVNSVHPGAINTDMVREAGGGGDETATFMASKVPLRRMGEPEEVAAVVAFLASDDASYCTGGEYTVDGGVSAHSGFFV